MSSRRIVALTHTRPLIYPSARSHLGSLAVAIFYSHPSRIQIQTLRLVIQGYYICIHVYHRDYILPFADVKLDHTNLTK